MRKKYNLIKRFPKRLILVFLGFFLIIGVSYFSQVKNVQKSGLTAEEKIQKAEINLYLDLLNRERFTEESKQPIRNFIKTEFEKYGYKVTEQKTDGHIAGISQRRVFINIIADKGSLDENYILIGAHYDTVPNTIGIDDNASGVAALLALAKYNQNHDIRFVAFDGEEYNLSGSRFYIKDMTLKPKLMVSLETIGSYSDKPHTQSIPAFYNLAYRGLYNRLKDNQFKGNFSTAICTTDAKDFCNKYESYASSIHQEAYSVYIPSFPFLRNFFLDLFRSDHTPFLLDGIPAVMVTDSANFRTPNYHKPSDTRETVNADFIAKQANAILALISKK